MLCPLLQLVEELVWELVLEVTGVPNCCDLVDKFFFFQNLFFFPEGFWCLVLKVLEILEMCLKWGSIFFSIFNNCNGPQPLMLPPIKYLGCTMHKCLGSAVRAVPIPCEFSPLTRNTGLIWWVLTQF